MHQPHPLPATPASSKKRTILIAAALLLLLGGLNIAQALLKHHDAQQTTQVLDEKEATLTQLRFTNDLLKQQLDSLKTTNSALSTEIEAYKTRLDAKEAAIARTIEGGNLDEARRQIQDLVQQKAAFAEEISQLKTANAHLRREVETVSGERDHAVGERDQLYERNTRAEAELAEARSLTENLAAAKDAAERENAKAQAALEADRYLRLSDVVAQPMEVNRKGDKSRPTKSAKSAHQVAIQFTVQPNSLVPAGTETFQIRIVPNAATGTTLGGDPNHTLTDKESGTEYPYTTVATCDYNQTALPVTAVWKLGERRLERGEYTVEVFNRGRKVGTTIFKVK